jgi:hypothetical protein
VAGTRPIELSSWYVVSRSLLRATSKSRYHVDNAIAEAVYSHHLGAREDSYITFSREIKVLRDGCERLVGYVFTVAKEWLEPWLQHVMFEVADMI